MSIWVSYESASTLSEAEKNASRIKPASSAGVMALPAATSRSRFSGQGSLAVPKATSPGMSDSVFVAGGVVGVQREDDALGPAGPCGRHQIVALVFDGGCAPVEVYLVVIDLAFVSRSYHS